MRKARVVNDPGTTEYPKSWGKCGKMVAAKTLELAGMSRENVGTFLEKYYRQQSPLMRVLELNGRGMFPSTLADILQKSKLPLEQNDTWQSLQSLLKHNFVVACLVQHDIKHSPHWVLLLGLDEKQRELFIYEPSATIPHQADLPLGNKRQHADEFLRCWDKVLLWRRVAFALPRSATR